jgi:hypothetical protein
MIQFNGVVLLESGAFKTIQELIQAAIEARDYDTPTQKAEAKSRMNPCIVGEGFIRPAADVYMSDAYKGVRNGVVDQSAWAAGDFTQSPGGGETLAADVSRHFSNGVHLGGRVLYNAGADVQIFVDVIIQ